MDHLSPRQRCCVALSDVVELREFVFAIGAEYRELHAKNILRHWLVIHSQLQELMAHFVTAVPLK
jgi:hypothetical protein